MIFRITTLSIKTTYPNGYGVNDARSLEGTAEFTVGRSSDDHKLSPHALAQVMAIVTQDIEDNSEAAQLPPGIQIDVAEKS